MQTSQLYSSIKPQPFMGAYQQRMFFGKGKKEQKAPEKKEETKEEQTTQKEETKDEPTAAAAEDSKPEQKEDVKSEKKKESSTSASESEGEAEEQTLSKAEVKKIKQLFNEQETEIKSLEKEIDTLKELLVKQEKETKKYQIEFTKQVRENEATVKRYRKMIDDEKQFAITKFAKDLLEVRDALRMALENTNKDTIKAVEELD